MEEDNKTLELGAVEAPIDQPTKKRGRKPDPNKSKMYFSDKEEEIFRQYCSSSDEKLRNKLFNETLYPVFTKMIESIIRRYTLFTPGEDFEDTFNDAMSHLISKVNHFDPNKTGKDGKPVKAYSYCGTVCKNYVLHKRQKAQDKLKTTLSYETVYNDIHPDLRVSIENPMENSNLAQVMIHKSADTISEMLKEPTKHNLNESDIKVGYAMINILNNWDDIFQELESKKYNKSQINSFIKETTLLSTKQIRDARKKFSNAYFRLKDEILSQD